MMKTQVIFHSKPVAHYDDSCVEDACARIRDLAHSLVNQCRSDMKGRQIVLYVGMLPGGGQESLPRKQSDSSLNMGLDELALLAVVDRSLRLHHHPAIKLTSLDADESTNTLTVTDCAGQEYEVTVRKKP